MSTLGVKPSKVFSFDICRNYVESLPDVVSTHPDQSTSPNSPHVYSGEKKRLLVGVFFQKVKLMVPGVQFSRVSIRALRALTPPTTATRVSDSCLYPPRCWQFLSDKIPKARHATGPPSSQRFDRLLETEVGWFVSLEFVGFFW